MTAPLDDRPIEGIDTLPVPEPGATFWADLHDHLVAADPHVGVGATVVELSSERNRAPFAHRRLLAVAAVLVVVVAGLVTFQLVRRDDPRPADRVDRVIDDPTSIDLDPWIPEPVTLSTSVVPPEVSLAPEPDEPVLAGNVNGRRWWLSLSNGDDTDELVEIAIWFQGMAVASAGSSPGPDATGFTGRLGRGAVAVDGGGVIMYGATMAALEHVGVVLGDGTTITLPTRHLDDGSTAYAVPVPAGLTISALDFFDAAGGLIHRQPVLMSHLPTVGSEFSLGDQLD